MTARSSNASSSDYAWPAEWEPLEAVWIAWPHNRTTWPGHFQNIPRTYVQFVAQLCRTTHVHVLSGPEGIEPAAAEQLRDLPHVTIHAVATNDTWIRDYGPTFVQRKSDRQLVGVHWRFNAWGGKYLPFDDDADAAEKICRIVGCECVPSEMFCEGGALEGDGRGTLLTTSSCLLAQTRNPGWSRMRVEHELKKLLGIQRILWIDGGGLLGDDTDSHIDQLARFVGPGKVVAAVSSVPDDPNATGLIANVQLLKSVTDAHGGQFEVFELPTPAPRFVEGKRVPESYCNFLFANGSVIVPTFRSHRTDQAAFDLLGGLLPRHEIVPVDAYDLIWGLGAFHCVSQQQPGLMKSDP